MHLECWYPGLGVRESMSVVEDGHGHGRDVILYASLPMPMLLSLLVVGGRSGSAIGRIDSLETGRLHEGI